MVLEKVEKTHAIMSRPHTPQHSTQCRRYLCRTYYVELWDGWPHGKFLDALPDGLITQNIDRMKINIVGIQYLGGCVAETTLWKELASLHEQQNRMVIDQGLNALLGILRSFLAKVVKRHGAHC